MSRNLKTTLNQYIENDNKFSKDKVEKIFNEIADEVIESQNKKISINYHFALKECTTEAFNQVKNWKGEEPDSYFYDKIEKTLLGLNQQFEYERKNYNICEVLFKTPDYSFTINAKLMTKIVNEKAILEFNENELNSFDKYLFYNWIEKQFKNKVNTTIHIKQDRNNFLLENAWLNFVDIENKEKYIIGIKFKKFNLNK